MRNHLVAGLPWEHLQQQLHRSVAAPKGQPLLCHIWQHLSYPVTHSHPAAKPGSSQWCLWCSEYSQEPKVDKQQEKNYHWTFFSHNCGNGISNRKPSHFYSFEPSAPKFFFTPGKDSLTSLRVLGLLPDQNLPIHTGQKETPAHHSDPVGTRPPNLPNSIWKINPKSRVSHRCEGF